MKNALQLFKERSIFTLISANAALSCLVLFLALMMAGCSNKNSGPPDLSLTLDIVSKNPDNYIGKRVKWYGEIVEVEIKKGHFNYVFVDTRSGNAFRAKTDTALGINYWVTGTVTGTAEVKVRGSGPYQSERKMVVPELDDTQFEKGESH